MNLPVGLTPCEWFHPKLDRCPIHLSSSLEWLVELALLSFGFIWPPFHSPLLYTALPPPRQFLQWLGRGLRNSLKRDMLKIFKIIIRSHIST